MSDIGNLIDLRIAFALESVLLGAALAYRLSVMRQEARKTERTAAMQALRSAEERVAGHQRFQRLLEASHTMSN